MSPERRRRAVRLLQRRFGVLRTTGVPRGGPAPLGPATPGAHAWDLEQLVRSRLRQIAAAKPRWGWRKAYWVLRSEGQRVNHTRFRAYWIDEGLKRPAKTRKRRRIGPRAGDRLTATHPDHVWALDFQVDVTADGRQIRFCNLVDEFTREALATSAARSFTADDTVILLDKIVAETGRRPEHLSMTTDQNSPPPRCVTGVASAR